MKSNYQEEFLKLSKGLYEYHEKYKELSGEKFLKSLKKQSGFDFYFKNVKHYIEKLNVISIDPISIYGHLNPLTNATMENKNLVLSRLKIFYKILGIKEVPEKIIFDNSYENIRFWQNNVGMRNKESSDKLWELFKKIYEDKEMINIKNKSFYLIDDQVFSCFAYNINKNYFPITKNTMSGMSKILTYINFNTHRTSNNVYRYITKNNKKIYDYLKLNNNKEYLSKLIEKIMNPKEEFQLSIEDKEFINKCFFDNNQFLNFKNEEKNLEM